MKKGTKKLLNLGLVAFITGIVFILSACLPQHRLPPPPEITYGEFPFTIIFEIRGERMIVEDVLIAEFVEVTPPRGFGNTEGGRRWRGGLKYNEPTREPGGAGISVLLYRIDSTRMVTAILPSAGHFMGDPIHALTRWKEPSIGHPRDTSFEELNFRLISFEIAPPIENTFR